MEPLIGHAKQLRRPWAACALIDVCSAFLIATDPNLQFQTTEKSYFPEMTLDLTLKT